MLTEYEARKLQDDMRRELNAPSGAVLKCAALLFLLVGIAWLGADSKDLEDPDSLSPVSLASAKADRFSRIFSDERRQRYIEAHPDSHLARSAAGKPRIQREQSHQDNGYFHTAGDYQEPIASIN